MDVELRTEFRLGDDIVLRAWREEDIESGFDAVMRNFDHLSPFMHWMTPDYSMESARKFIADSIAARKDRRSLGFGVFRGNELIGSIDFVGFDWPARKTEIGYWIDKSDEGKGIVTRSCRALIDYAFGELGLNRIEIRCSEENTRSSAVPERLGFKQEGVLRQVELRNGKLHDFKIYGLLEQDERLW